MRIQVWIDLVLGSFRLSNPQISWIFRSSYDWSLVSLITKFYANHLAKPIFTNISPKGFPRVQKGTKESQKVIFLIHYSIFLKCPINNEGISKISLDKPCDQKIIKNWFYLLVAKYVFYHHKNRHFVWQSSMNQKVMLE